MSDHTQLMCRNGHTNSWRVVKPGRTPDAPSLVVCTGLANGRHCLEHRYATESEIS